MYFAMLRRTDTTYTVASNWLYSVYMFVYLITLAIIPLFGVSILANSMYICWYANKLNWTKHILFLEKLLKLSETALNYVSH